MSTTTVDYRLLPGTRAAVGRAGAHHVIADRPEGKAGGMGLGFNGGELLALAVGGCFCNDVQALADEIGVQIIDLNVSVSIDFDGTPSRATNVRMEVNCRLEGAEDPAPLIERAKRLTTIGNSIRAGVPVQIEAANG
jgi:organic hydroperoxide reductase OsmC/OhrA